MKYSLILVIILQCFYCVGQEDMTLEKAIAIGLENNYNIKIADTNIRIAENNNTWARAGKGPTVDLNGFFTNVLVNDNNPASFLQGTYYAGSLGASIDGQWVLLSGGRIEVAKDQLEQAVGQQLLSKEQDIHNLLKLIIQQYYEVLYQVERKDILLRNLDLSKGRLAYEETKKEFGASNSYNTIQFESAVVTDSTNVISQNQGIEIAKRNLYNTLELLGAADYNFPERLSTTIEEIDSEKLREVLSEENYTLKSLEMIANLNALNTKLEESGRKPSLSISGSLGISENGFKFFADNPTTGEPFDFQLSNRLNGSVNLNAGWNLYNGGVTKTNVQNAELQQEIDQYSLLEAKAELNNQLDILISNYENQKGLIHLIDQQIQIAERNLDMTEERFKAGQISSIEYRAIQTQNVAIAFEKLSAIYNLIVLKSEIDFLVGKFEGK